MTAEAIARALGLKRSGDDYVGRCPCCGYKSGFAIRDGDDGKLLAICHTGKCAWPAIRDALVKLGLLQDDRESQRRRRTATKPTRIIRPTPSAPKTDAEIAALSTWQNAARVWRRGLPAAGTPVETYLREARGYTGPLPSPDVMRYVPDLWHTETETHWPGMVCLVEHAELGHVAIHRTWLALDGRGKAPVDPAKKTLAPVEGGAVRLMPPGPRGDIAVGEGIESSLSFHVLTGAPVWSAISAGGIAALILPPEVRFIAIIADGDPVGALAARNAARRFKDEGRAARIAMPPPGCDFNDILCKRPSNA